MRKVIIMRGLPGCGKSYWAHRFCIENKTSVAIVSADMYHYVPQPPNPDGTLVPDKYEFKPENARSAHNKCYLDFLTALSEGWSVIIVDNTNTTAWEIAPYYRYAEVMGLDVEIVYLVASIEKCMARGIHGVPAVTYERMQNKLANETLPPWWKQTIIQDKE